jgi:hypothetical protein
VCIDLTSAWTIFFFGMKRRNIGKMASIFLGRSIYFFLMEAFFFPLMGDFLPHYHTLKEDNKYIDWSTKFNVNGVGTLKKIRFSVCNCIQSTSLDCLIKGTLPKLKFKIKIFF